MNLSCIWNFNGVWQPLASATQPVVFVCKILLEWVNWCPAILPLALVLAGHHLPSSYAFPWPINLMNQMPPNSTKSDVGVRVLNSMMPILWVIVPLVHRTLLADWFRVLPFISISRGFRKHFEDIFIFTKVLTCVHIHTQVAPVYQNRYICITPDLF